MAEMKILFKLNPYNQQRQHEKKVWIFPIYLAMYATALRNKGNQVIWDGIDDDTYDKVITSEEQIAIDFLSLPKADRILTKAMDRKWQNNGNFKYLPGCYIASAKGCWHGACTFCVEKGSHYQVRDVNSVIEEVDECISLGFKEIFDDSGTFPCNQFLDDFCGAMIDRRQKGIKVSLGCNMRLIDLNFSQMKAAGFRMLLYGIESANQKTLDIINKGVKCEDIKYIKKASECGLDCHGAFMFGYPWETDEDAIRTLRLCHNLLKRGYLKTAQASFYNIGDGRGKESHRKYIRKIYDIWRSPQFWVRTLMSIHDVDDLKYLWRAIKKGLYDNLTTI